MIGSVKCDRHTDCFANMDGRCECLKDNRFENDRDCPFQKLQLD